MGKTYQVYVLRNWAGKFYIGLSEDPVVRLQQHNSGVSRWTRSRGPWKLEWVSPPMDLSSARKLESHLKRQKAGRSFYLITGLPPKHSGS
jgi:putative endonuclease